MTECMSAAQELCQKIIKGVYNTPAHVSPEAKDLLARMLTVVPDHRITFEQVHRLAASVCHVALVTSRPAVLVHNVTSGARVHAYCCA